MAEPREIHNKFFLILYEMGMDDKAVRRISDQVSAWVQW